MLILPLPLLSDLIIHGRLVPVPTGIALGFGLLNGDRAAHHISLHRPLAPTVRRLYPHSPPNEPSTLTVAVFGGLSKPTFVPLKNPP